MRTSSPLTRPVVEDTGSVVAPALTVAVSFVAKPSGWPGLSSSLLPSASELSVNRLNVPPARVRLPSLPSPIFKLLLMLRVCAASRLLLASCVSIIALWASTTAPRV